MQFGKLRALWALSKNGYLCEQGFFDSFKIRQCIDKSKQPIPWMAFPVIALLKERLKSSFRVLEFGAGASTLFFAARCREVYSFESSQNWYERVKCELPDNSRIFLLPANEYSTAAGLATGNFDVIVIDGPERNGLFPSLLEKCNESSVILWDDSQREEYNTSFRQLKALGWKMLRIGGIGPMDNSFRETAIFYRHNNCFDI